MKSVGDVYSYELPHMMLTNPAHDANRTKMRIAIRFQNFSSFPIIINGHKEFHEFAVMLIRADTLVLLGYGISVYVEILISCELMQKSLQRGNHRKTALPTYQARQSKIYLFYEFYTYTIRCVYRQR